MASSKAAGIFNRETIADLVTRNARSLLLLTLVITGVAALQLVDVRSGQPNIGIDPSVERLLSPDDEAYRFYQSARRIFGSDETIVLLLESGDVFARSTLDTISRLTARLEQLDDVVRIASLSNALTVRGSEFGIEIESWDDLPDKTPERLQTFRHDILSNPMYAGTLVSDDAGSTAILVSLADESGHAFLTRVEQGIRDIIDSEAADETIWITGPPVVNLATTNTLINDLARIPALVALVMATVLVFCFRSITGVLVPLASVGIAVTWAMAIIATLGYTLNLVTVLVPSLLMIICLSYSVHVVTEFFELGRQTGDAPRSPAAAFGNVLLPVVFTGLTTATGFLSLTLSPLAAIRELGILAVIGILTAMLVTLTFTPAVLTFLTRSSRTRTRRNTGTSHFERIALATGRLDARYRVPILAIAGTIFVVVLAGMSQVRVGLDYITNFPADSQVRQAYEKANALLGGANLFYIVIETGNRDAIKEPINLQTIRDLQDWLNRQHDIGGTVSIVDYIEQLNSAFHDNDVNKRSIPDSKKEIGQLLFFGANDDLERLVDSRYRVANVVVRTRAVNSDDMSALVDRIEKQLQQLPGHLQATVTGTPVLFDDVLDRIIRGQVQSVFTALIIVYIVLVGMFLSFRVGLIALIPNIFPVVTYFGALGYLGISLNPSNSLIAPMVLGIAIDDTIHYFARFNEFMKHSTDSKRAAIESLRVVGRPVTYTSLALCLGFLVLTGSDLKMQEQVGMMACFALAFAWLTDFTLTPALCSNLRIATLWDALTLDLGKRPQDTIPLFKGLSNFQARIVARMASIREYSAGERLIEIGQPGKEMYAVIDGKLQASIEGQQGSISLDSHARGDIVGEAGLFYQQRTANVDVTEDARLLCISRNDLDILSRRYPRIAAKVFHNLNEILANRLVHATERLS